MGAEVAGAECAGCVEIGSGADDAGAAARELAGPEPLAGAPAEPVGAELTAGRAVVVAGGATDAGGGAEVEIGSEAATDTAGKPEEVPGIAKAGGAGAAALGSREDSDAVSEKGGERVCGEASCDIKAEKGCVLSGDVKPKPAPGAGRTGTGVEGGAALA